MEKENKPADTAQQKTVIKLLMYSIDDIYDDFDLRSMDTRSISEDFISEVENLAKNSYGENPIIIRLISPRDPAGTSLTPAIQHITRERIKDYFRGRYIKLKMMRRKEIKLGWAYILSGLLCFGIFKYASLHEIKNLIANVVFDLISFVSWFATWNGVDTLKDMLPKSELKIYKRLAEAGIYFNNKK